MLALAKRPEALSSLTHVQNWGRATVFTSRLLGNRGLSGQSLRALFRLLIEWVAGSSPAREAISILPWNCRPALVTNWSLGLARLSATRRSKPFAKTTSRCRDGNP
jgi:hypothetical protein